ncbi:MAG: peptidylprolyl isomerase [Pirellulales bacterium]|nr:peptidylprolyl isomerase [Pirellulales bacterium]
MSKDGIVLGAKRRAAGWQVVVASIATSAVSLGLVLSGLSTAVFAQAPATRPAAGPKLSTSPRSAKEVAATPAPAGRPVVGGSPDANKPQIVAVVNREDISRNELAQQALWHYGEAVLESLVNRQVVTQQCAARGITVKPEEVRAEIERLATRFGLATDQYLQMLEEGRGITPTQYADDMVWPTLALRKVAAERLTVTQEDIDKAYETEYGPSVQVRVIVCDTEQKARHVHQMVMNDPENFPNIAKDESDDPNSGSARGLIQPIRRHLGDLAVEQAAFALKQGQISNIVPVNDKFVILKCEKHHPARPVAIRENVDKILAEAIRDKKLQAAAADLFKELQAASQVENIFNDPAKRKAMPGVAAIINGHKITMRELAEECIDRHGAEVLEGTISRKLLEQALRSKNLTITDADIDAEIAQAAMLMGKFTPDGGPDVQAWLDEVIQEQGMPMDLYVHDSVWPSAALKKLVGDKIEVTEADLQMGFEANFGPRVRIRAIVLNDMRRAQEVWEMARKNPASDYFGQLAEQYSVEASSRALAGQVPPVQRHGGQPMLEQEAFSLKPGELSGIVQVEDKFVVMLCEGRTEPVKVDFAEVREELFTDLREKKMRISMADYFARLKETAQIDNYIAGTTQSGVRNNEKMKLDPAIRKASATEELQMPAVEAPKEAKAAEGLPRAGSAQPVPQAAPPARTRR